MSCEDDQGHEEVENGTFHLLILSVFGTKIDKNTDSGACEVKKLSSSMVFRPILLIFASKITQKDGNTSWKKDEMSPKDGLSSLKQENNLSVS